MKLSQKCSSCKGPFHPSTGHVFTERSRLCGPCAKHMMKWWKGQMSRRSGGIKFYDHAMKKGNSDEA